MIRTQNVIKVELEDKQEGKEQTPTLPNSCVCTMKPVDKQEEAEKQAPAYQTRVVVQ